MKFDVATLALEFQIMIYVERRPLWLKDRAFDVTFNLENVFSHYAADAKSWNVIICGNLIM